MIEVIIRIEERQKDSVLVNTSFDADEYDCSEVEVDVANRITETICSYIDVSNESSAREEARDILLNIGKAPND